MSELELNEMRKITRRSLCRNGRIAEAADDEFVEQVIRFFSNIAAGIMKVAKEKSLCAEETEELIERSSEVLAERKTDVLELLKGGK